MNNMNGKIKHSGIIESMNGRHIRVRILQTSACASCKVSGHCHASESKEKMVDVYASGSSCSDWQVGEHVQVSATSAMVGQALLWSFGAPFILLVSVLFAIRLSGGSELQSALGALLSLLPYYLILFLCRNLFQRRITFSIEKTSKTIN